MASMRRNMFYQNKKQETTEIGTRNLPPFCDDRTIKASFFLLEKSVNLLITSLKETKKCLVIEQPTRMILRAKRMRIIGKLPGICTPENSIVFDNKGKSEVLLRYFAGAHKEAAERKGFGGEKVKSRVKETVKAAGQEERTTAAARRRVSKSSNTNGKKDQETMQWLEP
ncbi:hypothetical protein AAG570_007877 [Ranatra chinensis]|uniref:Uncharacterized protein n=1 Tax=Ranatra chinensis TaxID=642074 RepID=A0ABD0XT40_9HEMI